MPLLFLDEPVVFPPAQGILSPEIAVPLIFQVNQEPGIGIKAVFKIVFIQALVRGSRQSQVRIDGKFILVRMKGAIDVMNVIMKQIIAGTIDIFYF